MENIDLVEQFFKQHEESLRESDTIVPETVDTTAFDAAVPKIKDIINTVAEPKLTDEELDLFVSNIKESYIALSTNDDGKPEECDLGYLTAEISDILVLLLPQKADTDIALIACDIIDAIQDKYNCEPMLDIDQAEDIPTEGLEDTADIVATDAKPDFFD